MKNFFDKFKNYSFWVSLSSAIVILLTSFGKLFGFTVENKIVEDCIMSIAGLFVVLGIVSMNSKSDNNDKSDDTSDDEDIDKNKSE